MIPLNNYSFIKIIDNTKKGSIIDNTYVAGYSEIDRLIYPNMGKIIVSDLYKKDTEVIFFNFDLIFIKKNIFAINNKAIFISNQELCAEGFIVESLPYSKKTNHLSLGKQNFFQVKQQLFPFSKIKISDLIIIRPRACYKFNMNQKEYYFINPKNVIVYINQLGIFPNTGYQFIQKHKEKSSFISYKKEKKNIGILNHKKVLFSLRHKVSDINIKGIEYHIVTNDGILGEC